MAPIFKTNETGLSRCTSICFSKELLEHIEFLLEESKEEYFEELRDFANKLQEIVNQYGLNNVLFFRDSDEDMGGQLPEELKKLEETAIWTQEYH